LNTLQEKTVVKVAVIEDDLPTSNQLKTSCAAARGTYNAGAGAEISLWQAIYSAPGISLAACEEKLTAAL